MHHCNKMFGCYSGKKYKSLAEGNFTLKIDPLTNELVIKDTDEKLRTKDTRHHDISKEVFRANIDYCPLCGKKLLKE